MSASSTLDHFPASKSIAYAFIPTTYLNPATSAYSCPATTLTPSSSSSSVSTTLRPPSTPPRNFPSTILSNSYEASTSPSNPLTSIPRVPSRFLRPRITIPWTPKRTVSPAPSRKIPAPSPFSITVTPTPTTAASFTPHSPHSLSTPAQTSYMDSTLYFPTTSVMSFDFSVSSSVILTTVLSLSSGRENFTKDDPTSKQHLCQVSFKFCTSRIYG